MKLITDPEMRFTVELRSVVCEHCQSGAEYVIVDHVEDCELLGMSWGTEEDAWGYHAAILAGYSAALRMPSPAFTIANDKDAALVMALIEAAEYATRSAGLAYTDVGKYVETRLVPLEEAAAAMRKEME